MVLSFPICSFAAPVLAINNPDAWYMIGSHADALEDPGGGLSVRDVTEPPHRYRFTPLGADIPNLGFTSSTYWLRVEVVNASGAPQTMILAQISSWIDQLDLTVIRAGGGMETRLSGAKYPFYDREIANPQFLFSVDLAAEEKVTLLLRVKSDDPVQLPMTLWKKKAFEIHNLGFSLYFGVIYGCLLAVLLYNFFIFLSLRDTTYLYYVLYISSLLFMIFTYSGSSYQYIWPDSPRFQALAPFATGYISMFLAISFAKRFLGTAGNLPGAHRFLGVFQGLILLSAVAGFAMRSQYFISLTCTVMAIVFPPTQAAIGVMAYRNNIRSARFFVVAWSFSMFGILFTMGSVTGLYSSSLASQRSMEMGLVIDAILLSFALADKIRILRQEKERAEEETRRTLARSKAELEDRVEKRTQELKSAKDTAEAAILLNSPLKNPPFSDKPIDH